MPPRDKRFQQADQLAGTMFNVFPQGVGERVSGAAQAVGGAIGSAINRFTNPFGALASDIGAVRQAVSGTRLIGRRSPMTVPPTPMTTVLPSGTPMVGFDAYPTAPQSIPRTVEPFRGNASTEAAKKYEGLPPHLQTAVDRMNMSPQTTSVVDTARSPLSGINAPIDTSVQGMDVNRSPIATRVPEMPSSLSAAPSFDLSGATQQTTPLLTNQVPEMPINVAQAKVPIKTPYGTIYATAEQAAKPRVAEIANLPANSARLERIGEEARRNVALRKARQAGRAIGRANVENMENYFQQKQAERVALREASEEARRSGVGSKAIREARAKYTSKQPSSVAGIRRDYARMVPNFDRPMEERTAFVREPFNIPNQNQPMGGFNFASSGLPYTNSVYQNPFSLNFGLGY